MSTLGALSAPPAISVVIPTLGRRPEVLGRALGCLERQSAGREDFEVIVVGDAAGEAADLPAGLPTDPPTAAAAGARTLRAARPGASAARNHGWRAATAPLVLFLDDDVLADPGLVAEHLAAHAADPRPQLAVLGDVRWADELRRTPFMRWLDEGIQFDYGRLEDGQDAGWGRFYTANLSVKRELLERVGGFDEERFPFGYEDLDLGLRAHRDAGLELRYSRAASAQHLHQPRLVQWRTRVARIAASERRFVERHPEVEPHFLGRFGAASRAAPARGLSARLASVVPVWVPWLGPRAKASADAVFAQDLAPRFLAAWERAGDTPAGERAGDTAGQPVRDAT